MRNAVLLSAILLLALLSLITIAGIALVQRTVPAVDATDQQEAAVEAEKLELVGELLKTHYHVGERIRGSVTLNNMNFSAEPLTLRGVDPALFFRVYDEENRMVVSQSLKLRLDDWNFRPGEVNHQESWFGHYSFALDQPGRYRLVFWAELRLDKNLADPLRIYADPLRIEIITGRKVSFWPVTVHSAAATPEEVRNWVKSSLKFDMTDFANTKEFDGKQYLFVRSGISSRDGPEPFERVVRIVDVLVMAEEVVVRASFSKPSPAEQLSPAALYDVVYIKATGLPVRFVPITRADEEIFIGTIVGIHFLPDIVAHSRSIKLFAPAPTEAVGRRFTVSGVANTFEATIFYGLGEVGRNSLDGGSLMAGHTAPGFTRNPVLTEEHLVGATYWLYFTFDIEVPTHVADGSELVLAVYAYSTVEGDNPNTVSVPLRLDAR
jgi:hypothetical protein